VLAVAVWRPQALKPLPRLFEVSFLRSFEEESILPRNRYRPSMDRPSSNVGNFSRRELSMDPKHDARLIRRMLHLRTMMHYTHDALIVVTLKEFIAETEIELLKLKADQTRKITLH
jgi:hypothetical protein